MRTMRNGVALLLAAALALMLAACGKSTNDSLHARFSALYESDALQQMLDDPDGHAAEIAAYGVEDFAATFANADAFRSYTVEIRVQNTNGFSVQLTNVQAQTEKQGKNGVWFSALDEAAMVGLPADYSGDETLYCYAIADASLSKEDVLRTLGEMGVSCVYMKGSEAPDMDAKIDPALLHTSVILYEG